MRNGCKAFVAEISRTCFKEIGERRLITRDELFARNGVGGGVGLAHIKVRAERWAN